MKLHTKSLIVAGLIVGGIATLIVVLVTRKKNTQWVYPGPRADITITPEEAGVA